MSTAPKLPAGVTEGGWTDRIRSNPRRGARRSLVSAPAAPIVQPKFEAWHALINGSEVWAVVEVKDGKFVRKVRDYDIAIDRSTFPLTKERAQEIAASLNGGGK